MRPIGTSVESHRKWQIPSSAFRVYGPSANDHTRQRFTPLRVGSKDVRVEMVEPCLPEPPPEWMSLSVYDMLDLINGGTRTQPGPIPHRS